MIMDAIILKNLHIDELIAMYKMKRKINSLKTKKSISESISDKSIQNMSDEEFCQSMLAITSRSFYFVIETLDHRIKQVICVYYLILRILDTIEDDMEYKDLRAKTSLLENFHFFIKDENYTIEEFGKGFFKLLVKHCNKVFRVYNRLDEEYRQVIKGTVEEMGKGMAEFCGSKIMCIDTSEMYNEYARIVAGILGKGLTKIFVISRLESSEDLMAADTISNSMGLFLQKTNIIRDYLEDFEEGRTWWPKEIWSKHADSLGYFSKHPDDMHSLECLNEMILDALNHFPDSYQYLSKLKNNSVFKFCAIPQLMALSTLTTLYNNKNVFTGCVRIRRGLTARIFVETETFEDFERFSSHHLCELAVKMGPARLAQQCDDKRWAWLAEKAAALKKPQKDFGCFELLELTIALCLFFVWMS